MKYEHRTFCIVQEELHSLYDIVGRYLDWEFTLIAFGCRPTVVIQRVMILFP